MKKLTIIVAAVLLFGGCASLDDFREMSPTERASYVCDRDDNLLNLKHEIFETEMALSEVEEAIEFGYRVHVACKEVPIVSGSKEVCTTDAKGVKTCTVKSEISNETACEERTIPIDGQLEREKESQYRQDLQQLRPLYDTKYNNCFNAVRVMSADEAFDIYDSGRSVTQ